MLGKADMTLSGSRITPPLLVTAIHRMVEDAKLGQNPRVICRMPSGWAVLGERQVMRGYSLLLPDPVVPHLNAMDEAARGQFLRDMSILGDAILSVTRAVRINYEMLGNLEPALHAHVIPRYGDMEPQDLKTRPIWFYDWEKAPLFDGVRDAELMRHIGERLRSKI